MSRVAKAPVNIPAGVEVKLDGQLLTVKGKNGELSRTIHNSVEVKQDNGQFTFTPREGFVGANAQSGTARALVNAMVIGVTEGFTKKLQLVGVGYRAQIKRQRSCIKFRFLSPCGAHFTSRYYCRMPFTNGNRFKRCRQAVNWSSCSRYSRLSPS